MSDPTRLVEQDSDSLAAELLRSGRDEQPSRGARDRTLSVIGASATLAASTTLSSGASGALTGAAAAGVKGGLSTAMLAASVKWIAVGTMAGIATLATVRHLSQSDERLRTPSQLQIATRALSLPSSLVLPSAAAPSPPASAASPASSDTPAADSVSVPRPLHHSKAPAKADPPQVYPHLEQPKLEPPDREQPTEPAPENPPVKEPELPSPELSALRLEIARIDAARGAFQAGDFARALTTLQGYERDFPNPKLYQEVLFLRMASAHKLGNAALAEQLATRLVSSYPHSPHNALARAILGERGSRQYVPGW